MLLGQVAGKVWATKKSPALTGQALLTVAVDGALLVCADCVGAGGGGAVLVATGGAARVAAGAHIPIDAAIVGIIDGPVGQNGTVRAPAGPANGPALPRRFLPGPPGLPQKTGLSERRLREALLCQAIRKGTCKCPSMRSLYT